MPPRPTPLVEPTPDQRAAVDAALRRRDLAPRLRERLEMVKAAAIGQDVASIARWSGRDPATVRRWLAAFRTGGVAALADAPRVRPAAQGRRRLPGRRLEAAVETSPRALGLGVDVWTSARLSAYLAAADRRHGVPGLAAGAAGAAALRLRPAQARDGSTCKTRPRSPPARSSSRRRGKKVAADPAQL